VPIVAQTVAQSAEGPLDDLCAKLWPEPVISQEDQWARPRTRPMWRMGWTKLATWSRRLSQCRPSPVSTLLLAGWGRPALDSIGASQTKPIKSFTRTLMCNGLLRARCKRDISSCVALGKFLRVARCPPLGTSIRRKVSDSRRPSTGLRAHTLGPIAVQ